MKDQKITRNQLSKIYAIACPDWENTLNELLSEQKFEQDITITNEMANKMFKDADEKQTKILLKIIKKPESIFDKVTGYEAALKLNGDQCRIVKSDAPDEIAYKQLKAITKACNDGKVVDRSYAMANRVYVNLFYFNSAGLGCVWAARVSGASTHCGFRLCFFSREAAEYAAEHFTDLYEQFYSA